MTGQAGLHRAPCGVTDSMHFCIRVDPSVVLSLCGVPNFQWTDRSAERGRVARRSRPEADGGEWMAGCATFAWLQDMAADKLSSVTGHGGLPDVCSKKPTAA